MAYKKGMYLTLKDVLSETQDMGESNADRLCDDVMNDTFDYKDDPVSGIIANAFINNGYDDYDSMETDLDYAINQLTKARNYIKNRI